MGSCQASVFGPKVLKNVPAFCHTQLQWKVIECFRNTIRKMRSVSCAKIVLIEKNRAKYVNQTGNIYFWPKLKTTISLPMFNILENFCRWKFMLRPIHQPKNQDFNKMVSLKVYGNLNAAELIKWLSTELCFLHDVTPWGW